MIFARSVVALLASTALALTACGDDDTTDPTAPAGTGAVVETTEPDQASEPTRDAATTTESPAGGTMSPEDAAAVDAAAAAFLQTAAVNGVTALYVGISDPDTGDYLHAYGDAAVDGPAATIDDNFRIGSISKTFTATVLLQLVEEGELALDDTVEELLPDRAVDYPDLAPLTVEQLLAMQSGVADYLNVPDSVVVDIVDDPSRVWGAEELIAAGLDAGVEPPGTPGYSTTNYLVLQLIAESLTGTSLQELITERVTDRLALGATFLPPNDDTDLPDPATRGYVAGGCVNELEADGATVDEGTDVTDWNASYGQGGGGMTSSITDLTAWAGSLSGNSLLGDDLAAARLDFADIGGVEYGLGMLRFGSWIGHEGEAIGWEAVALHDPDTGVTVALAANGCGGLVVDFAAFVDTLYPDGGFLDALFPDTETEPTDTSVADGDGGAASTDTTTDTTTETTTVAGGGASGESSGTTAPEEQAEVPVGGASGTATFTSGGISITGDVAQCAIDGQDVDFVVQGENAGFEVYSIDGGDVGVTVYGMVEWEGRGQASVDGGSISISGGGSLADAGATTEDFTVTAEISSC